MFYARVDRSVPFLDHELYVHPGGCFIGDNLVSCALEESGCNGLIFKSYYDLLRETQAETLNTGFCWQHILDRDYSTLDASDLFTGMCTSSIDKYHCTGHPSNCIISAKFVPSIPFCTVKFNYFPKRQSSLSVYGECVPVTKSDGEQGFYGDGTCVWSMDDCQGIPENNTFYPGTASLEYLELEKSCSCEKVKTGACHYKDDDGFGEYVCAVSDKACGDSGTFQTWQELVSADRDCRLCIDSDKNMAEVEVSTGLLSSNRGQDQYSNYFLNKEQDVNMPIGVITGSLVSGCLVGALFARLYYQAHHTTATSSPTEEPITNEKLSQLDADLT